MKLKNVRFNTLAGLTLGCVALAGWQAQAGSKGPSVKAPAPNAAKVQTAKAAKAAKASAPFAAMDPQDARKPVPLLPMMAFHQKKNMRQHLVAVQRITDAVSREDWKAAEEASKLIGTSPKMTRMCKHMGSGAPGFTQLGMNFHRLADGIGVAARTHDGKKVLHALSDTLQACTSCHAAYKQEVLSPDLWKQRTGAKALPSMKMKSRSSHP